MMFASRMKIYTVYLKPSKDNPYEDAVFIPEGFSFAAFLFTGFWALTKKCWLLAVLFFILPMGCATLAHMAGLSSPSVAVIDIGLRVLIGFFAYDGWRATLRSNRWVLHEVIVAYSELEAGHRYYERHVSAVHPQPARSTAFPA